MVSQESTDLHIGECVPVSVLGLPRAIQAVLDREFGCVQMLSLVGYLGVLRVPSLSGKKVEMVAAAMDSLGYTFLRPRPVAPKKVRMPRQKASIDTLYPLFEVWNNVNR